MRPMPNAAPKTTAMMAIVLPMPVPTTARAMGCRPTASRMNGIGRKVLTTTLSSTLTTRFGAIPPARVTYRVVPMRSPSSPPIVRPPATR